MSYQHLNTFERARIVTLKGLGHSIRQIAEKIGRARRLPCLGSGEEYTGSVEAMKTPTVCFVSF
ncbi:hypothetical protein BTO28_12910 [Domibacillus epiphyticus]|uniref:Uncharacterized protein n=1 Tax=Domibacillus epiphyticus TaxID=1714355 RepID=A0A1V2A5R8_9BACI|nr:hypothetical protein BTO28_12910 [Domibacillus epiphyticus]